MATLSSAYHAVDAQFQSNNATLSHLYSTYHHRVLLGYLPNSTYVSSLIRFPGSISILTISAFGTWFTNFMPAGMKCFMALCATQTLTLTLWASTSQHHTSWRAERTDCVKGGSPSSVEFWLISSNYLIAALHGCTLLGISVYFYSFPKKIIGPK